MLDELLSIALIGTSRSGSLPAPRARVLQEATSAIEDASPEQKLLTNVALITAYQRSGCKPSAAVGAPTISGDDECHVCTNRAADLLSELIRDNAKELIAEWLAAAVSARRRAPHRLLPSLFDLAAKETSLRDNAVIIGDRRGRWLIAQNPNWQFAAADSVDESVWETGTPEQRLAVLRHVRRTEPAKARDLLQKSWKDDPAEQRTEFLKTLAIGLSIDDEPLLESLLDDRSKQVRERAADLLGRLPQSRLVQRMIGRAAQLLEFKRGLLKGVKLEMTLPADLDKGALRDGIDKTPPAGVGQKQWWLQQIISFVPPVHWTASADLKPSEWIASVSKTDFAQRFIHGAMRATERNPDPVWADLLTRHKFEIDGLLHAELVAILPPAQLKGLALDILRDKRVSLYCCGVLIAQGPRFDPAVGRLWVQTVSRLAKQEHGFTWHEFWKVVGQSGQCLPIEARQEIEACWLTTDPPFSSAKNMVENVLKALDVRQQIQREFAS